MDRRQTRGNRQMNEIAFGEEKKEIVRERLSMTHDKGRCKKCAEHKIPKAVHKKAELDWDYRGRKRPGCPYQGCECPTCQRNDEKKEKDRLRKGRERAMKDASNGIVRVSRKREAYREVVRNVPKNASGEGESEDEAYEEADGSKRSSVSKPTRRGYDGTDEPRLAKRTRSAWAVGNEIKEAPSSKMKKVVNSIAEENRLDEEAVLTDTDEPHRNIVTNAEEEDQPKEQEIIDDEPPRQNMANLADDGEQNQMAKIKFVTESEAEMESRVRFEDPSMALFFEEEPPNVLEERVSYQVSMDGANETDYNHLFKSSFTSRYLRQLEREIRQNNVKNREDQEMIESDEEPNVPPDARGLSRSYQQRRDEDLANAYDANDDTDPVRNVEGDRNHQNEEKADDTNGEEERKEEDVIPRTADLLAKLREGSWKEADDLLMRGAPFSVAMSFIKRRDYCNLVDVILPRTMGRINIRVNLAMAKIGFPIASIVKTSSTFFFSKNETSNLIKLIDFTGDNIFAIFYICNFSGKSRYWFADAKVSLTNFPKINGRQLCENDRYLIVEGQKRCSANIFKAQLTKNAKNNVEIDWDDDLKDLLIAYQFVSLNL